MLTYLNRQMKKIDVNEWKALIRLPMYVNIEHYKKGEKLLQLSWLGVVSELEKKPRIYCIQIKEKEDCKTLWFADIEVALIKFNGLRAEMVKSKE